MRLVHAGAVAALVSLSFSSLARADEPPSEPEEAPAEAAAEPPSDLLVPTPPEWRIAYEEARTKLLTGEFTDAAARFDALERSAVNRVDRAVAREQKTLAEEWARKHLAFVNRRDLGESSTSAKALDRRTTDELVSLYTNGVFYGIGSGIWLATVTEPKSAAAGILPTIGLTAATVGGIVALDSGRGLRYGVAQSIVSGLYIGLEEGIAWTVWQNTRNDTDLKGKEQATIIWGLATAGAVTGGVLGETLGTTPGRSSWVGSTALWTGTLLAFGTGAVVKPDDPPPAVFAAAGVGLTLGTGIGLGTASAVSPSIARVRFLDLGGLAGGLLSAGLYVALANDKADGRAASGITALGGLGGLGAAWALTSSMADDRPRSDDGKPAEDEGPIAKLRPMMMPAQGGGMLGVGGLLE